MVGSDEKAGLVDKGCLLCLSSTTWTCATIAVPYNLFDHRGETEEKIAAAYEERATPAVSNERNSNF